jgi:carbamoyltransferase
MYILGLSCFFHDAAAALLRDGVLVAAAEEERFTRKKHDSAFPKQAIQFCLDQAGIQAKDLDHVVFFEKPLIKFERILLSTMGTFPKSWRVFREAMGSWLREKMWVKSLIQREIGVDQSRILFSEHHLSHAASTFFCSPFEEAAILTVDGVGEWATASFGVGKSNKIRLLKEIHFPHSLGLLYSAFTAFLGFEVNEGEYKVMGMAPYGQPRYVDKVWKLITVYEDGSFWLDMDYFSFQHSTEHTYSSKFEQLFGKPREPKSLFFTQESGYPSYFGEKPGNYNELCVENQHYADIAASIQVVTEDVMLNMAKALHRDTGLRRLCLAGGVALNSVANSRLLRESGFEELYIQPSPGDGGGALGGALYVYHHVLNNPRSFVMDHAYWGQAHSHDAIRQFLVESGIRHEFIGDEDGVLDRTVETLKAGNVVGWFNGRFEWGPRALGNRSILGDPRRAEMKDIVNTKIKFREPYRPFAPSILVEHCESFFDLAHPAQQYPARFMLYVVDVKPEKRDVIPATTHANGTGRVQVVLRETNPRYYRLIERFHQATGVPVILNTSFNLKGEPVVNTPREAYSSFMRSGIDLLVLDQFLVWKEK